jgi:Zn-dependent peptidase ImmA (M78 family)
LAEILETQGVRTGVVNLPSEVSGLTINHPSVGLFIVANGIHTTVRRRFSLAHEYAHVLFDRRLKGIVTRTQNRDEPIEVRANAFAAAFLMPEEGVRHFVESLGKGRPSRSSTQVFDEEDCILAEGRMPPGSQTIQLYDVVHLAHYFGVSRLAALFRLWNLRLVSQAEFEGLRLREEQGEGRELARLLALSEIEEGEDGAGFRHRVLNLGLEAYRRELITLAKLRELAQLLSMSEPEIEILLERARSSDTQDGDATPQGQKSFEGRTRLRR